MRALVDRERKRFVRRHLAHDPIVRPIEFDDFVEEQNFWVVGKVGQEGFVERLRHTERHTKPTTPTARCQPRLRSVRKIAHYRAQPNASWSKVPTTFVLVDFSVCPKLTNSRPSRKPPACLAHLVAGPPSLRS